jgi:pyrimidine operon attenuation protein/uracil phosphoribosyltransferase
MHKAATVGHEKIAEALSSIVEQIIREHRETPELAVAGIANGGMVFSRRLAEQVGQRLHRKIPLGVVNIAFHRDDIGRQPIPLNSAPTDLPFAIDDATIILADDVFFTGRTVRAAVNELFDQGRPARVELAVLCDRGGRRLPIVPDYVGLTFDTAPEQRVEVRLDERKPVNDVIRILTA